MSNKEPNHVLFLVHLNQAVKALFSGSATTATTTTDDEFQPVEEESDSIQFQGLKEPEGEEKSDRIQFQGLEEPEGWWTPYLNNSHLSLGPWPKPSKKRYWCTRSTLKHNELPFIKNSTDVKTGILYMAIPKASSSTSQGVNVRIARRVGERVFWKGHHDCTHYNSAHYLNVKQFRFRDPKKSFIWSTIREPWRRDLSEIYHFEVTRKNLSTDDTTITGKLAGMKSRQTRLLSFESRGASSLPEQDLVRVVQEDILSVYDFLGVVERMDESLAVLSLLLNVPATDVIVLNAKNSGGYDDHKNCYLIQKANVTPAVKNFVQSDQYLQRNPDLFLYYAANRKLDRTIEMLGLEAVQDRVKTIAKLHTLAKHYCQQMAIFPCSPTGKFQYEFSKHDCYSFDSGCGFKCVDAQLRQFDNE